eukprot:GEMP01040421.1.p1 GENE.GEMP01040421.1~~GEMP01040421.1.p1  ORF type:complete len:512 (+),score=139.02 GEMP01040421.1:113-1648(+)
MDPDSPSCSSTAPACAVSDAPASLTLSLEELCDILCQNLHIAEPNVPLEKPFVAAAVNLFGPVAVEKALHFDVCDSVEDIAEYIERHQNDEDWAIPIGTLNERMRIQMATAVFGILEESGRRTLDMIFTLVKNLIHRPDDEKVRTLRLSNEKLRRVIFSVPRAVSLLEFVGFVQAKVLRKKPPFVEEKALVFRCCPLSNTQEGQKLQALYSMLDDLLLSLPPADEDVEVVEMVSVDPREEAADGRLTRACMADIHENRLMRKIAAQVSKTAYQRGGSGFVARRAEKAPSQPTVHGAVPEDNAAAPEDNSWWSSLFGSTQEAQNRQSPSESRERKKKHMTLSDIEKLRYDEAIGNMPRYAEEYMKAQGTSSSMTQIISKFSDPAYLGRVCLDRTNIFRGEHGMVPLKWNEPMYEIAREHAQQMADGVMPFSHEGFSRRADRFPFYHMSAAENIAWNAGVASPADVAVTGWINSPGHRKNLLSNSNLCAIGVHIAGGRVYFTQLCARTPGALC